MEGWIKLHRKIRKSTMYKKLNSKQRDVLIQLLLMADHQGNEWEYQGQIFRTKPGQFVTSLESIRKECAEDVTIQNIRTCIAKLKKWRFLTNESTKTGRLITLINWDVYQSVEKNQQSNQQRSNKDLTTNKNVKNDKEKPIDQSSAHATDRSTYSEEFETFWKSYPRKVGKKRAYLLWEKRINYFQPKLRATVADLIRASQNYALYCEMNVDNKKYIKHPSTFLSEKLDYLDYVDWSPEDEKIKTPDKEQDKMDRVKQGEWVNSGKTLDSEEDLKQFNSWIKRGGNINELYNGNAGDNSRKSTDRVSAD